jgi:hypothetical protein
MPYAAYPTLDARTSPGASCTASIRYVWADSAYTGDLVEWWQDEHGITIEIVGKQLSQHTFVVAPKR